VNAPLAEATDKVNESTKEDLLAQIVTKAKPKDTVLVLGVAYKPDTYIVEESAGLFLAQNLKRQGYRVLVHDFAANTENSPDLLEFEILKDVQDLAKRDDIKVAGICCPWPQYRNLKFAANTAVVSPWKM
jgi:UDPglucose 6-dehydrogenase